MEKIIKFMKSLTEKERDKKKIELEKLKKGEFKDLNIKKLKGYENIFRLKKGQIRIVYKKEENSKIELIFIVRRTDRTYKNLQWCLLDEIRTFFDENPEDFEF